MSVRQVWKRKTPPPKSSPTCHNDSPPPPPRNTPHSISPPMNYPQRDQIINQLHTISTLIDSQIPTPPSSPLSLVQPPTHAQVGCHASFCHCCRLNSGEFDSTRPGVSKSLLFERDTLFGYPKVIDTPHSIDLNIPYQSVECQYAVLNLQNTSYCLDEQDTLYRLQISIHVSA
ncbi:hypothetical protein Tco_0280441 [Tanacetum coccineum]